MQSPEQLLHLLIHEYACSASRMKEGTASFLELWGKERLKERAICFCVECLPAKMQGRLALRRSHETMRGEAWEEQVIVGHLGETLHEIIHHDLRLPAKQLLTSRRKRITVHSYSKGSSELK